MWLHIIIGYMIISLIIMEIVMKDKIGIQEYPLQRASFYIGGLLIGPIAALFGFIKGIKDIWDSGGR